MGTEGSIMASLVNPDPIERLVAPAIAYEARQLIFSAEKEEEQTFLHLLF